MTTTLRPAPSPTITGQDAGAGRSLHAYPDGSDIALCGAVKARTATGRAGQRCPTCEREAGRKHWIGR